MFKRSSLIAFLLCLISQAAVAKNFYLTVRRDYSPDEEPQIEVIYSKEAPLRLRLLKPKNMDAFIKEQIDLRRAWKEPRTEVNSARPLIVGFNRSTISVDWIRYHFQDEVRTAAPKPLMGSAFVGNSSNFVEGPSKLIRAPEGFEVVSDFTISSESDDKTKPFDVPGFWYSDSNHKTRLVNLPKQASGFYVLQVLQGSDEGQVVLVVNNVKAMLQQTDGLAIVRTTTRNGEPIENANIKLRNVAGAWIGEGTTDKNGVSEIKTGENTELIAAIESKQGTAIIDTEFLSAAANFPDVFIYTDRPMYKPEGSAKFKAILRHKESGISDLLDIRQPVTASIISGEDSLVSEGKANDVTEFGSVSGEVPLTNAQASGVYRIQTLIDGINYTGELRVKDYVKPLFFVTMTSSADSAKPGDRIPIKLKAERYAGGVPSGVSARVEVLRMRFDGPEWVEDAGKGEKANETTYGFDRNSEVPIIPISVYVAENLQFSSDGTYSGYIDLPNELPGDASYDYKLVAKVTAQDSDGNYASTSKTFLEATSNFMLQARSSAVFVEKGQKAWVEVRALTPGGKPFGRISGTFDFIHTAYGKAPQSVRQQKFESDEQGKFKVDYPTNVVGTVTAAISLTAKGDTRKSEQEILIAEAGSFLPVKNVLDMTLLSRKSIYTIGETAKALVLLPENWGINGSGTGYVYTTIAGSKIFKTQSEKISGQTYWINLPITEDLGTNVFVIVAYSDPKLGFIERRIQYQIVPVEKILNVKLAAVEDTVSPGGEQTVHLEVKDYKGKPVKSELSLSVVDRAVLDLQSEFRPQLLEFFYPKDRLNMMTFYSNEFQSYGYSETIAKMFKPNYAFSATKPAEEKQKEEDTAYWNPNIVTDSKGKASVTFRLPINQTIWRMTAVAIDKDGRFGEAQSEFKAQTETPITLAMPNKVRKGETFVVRVSANSLSKAKTFKIDLNVKLAGVTAKEPIAPIKLELKPGQNETYRFALTSDLDEKRDIATVEIAAVIDGKALSFAQEVKLIDGYNHAPVNERFPESGRLELAMAKGEKLTQPKVRIMEGFTGAVMPAIHWMTSYPHGCIEQLTNTTIPNLAIADIFSPDLIAPPAEAQNWFMRLATSIKRFFVGLLRGIINIVTNKKTVALTDLQQKALTDAVKNARIGVEKINALQRKEGYEAGSFDWFDGIEADSRMHYYILMSFVSVERAELLKGIDLASLYKVLGFYRYQQGFEEDTKNVLNRYIRSQLNRLKIIDEPIGAADLRFSLEVALKQQNPLLVAYALRTVQEAKPEDAKTVSDIRKDANDFLVKSLDTLIAEKDNIRPVSFNTWEGYIGRRGSTIAVIARALYAEKKMSEALIERVRVALLEQFNGQNFGSTFDTGQILLNSTWLIRHEIESRRVRSAPKVQVNGKTVDREGELILAGWEISAGDQFSNVEKVDISVDKKNPSDRVHLVGFRTVPLSDAKPVAGEYEISRNMYRLNETTQELVPLRDGESVQIGDLIYIENLIKGGDKRDYFASSYYLLENDLPSGAVLVEDDNRFNKLAVDKNKAGWKKREEVRGRLNYYFSFERGWSDTLRAGTTVGYIVRMNYAGTFNSGVTRFMDFYDEANFSQTGSFSFNVEPPGTR